MRKSTVVLGMIVTIVMGLRVLGATGPAQTPEPRPDVAIVTLVSGNVTYQARTGEQTPAPVYRFMKLYQDDLVTLPEGAQMKLLYHKTGRQETWPGPVALKAFGVVARSAMP